MALSITGHTRVFKFKKNNETITLNDPNSELPPDSVMQFYSGSHPELTTATIDGPKIEDGNAVYEFKTTVGTKG